MLIEETKVRENTKEKIGIWAKIENKIIVK